MLPGGLQIEPPIDPKTKRFTRPWVLWFNSLSSSGGGVPSAPANAQYVVGVANGSLPNARVATTSTDVSVDISVANIMKWFLTTTGVAAGTYGDSSHVASFTVDTKGRLSFAANVAITHGTQQYVPATTGAIPGEIMFVGPDVLEVLTTLP